MIFGSYIAGTCSGDTLKRKLSSVRYFKKLSRNLTVTHNYGTDYSQEYPKKHLSLMPVNGNGINNHLIIKATFSP